MASIFYQLIDNNEVLEPMELDHFEIAVSHMRLSDEKLIGACKRVLVDGERNSDVATELELNATHTSTTCQNIIKKWNGLSEEKGLINRTFALKPEFIDLVAAIEKLDIDDLRKLKKIE